MRCHGSDEGKKNYTADAERKSPSHTNLHKSISIACGRLDQRDASNKLYCLIEHDISVQVTNIIENKCNIFYIWITNNLCIA